MQQSIAIIGCGNLGLALANGILAHIEFKPEQLALSKRNIATLDLYSKKGVFVTSNNKEVIKGKRIVFLAVKPYDVDKILNEIKDDFNPDNQLIVSVATGITSAQLLNHLPGATVFRAMPNTAADIGESMTCISTNSQKQEELDEVAQLFNLMGNSIYIKEELMESATVLAACGIAYVLRFMRSMVQGGIQIGFDANTATEIVNHVVRGAADLLITNKQHPETEIDKVTTPKGCTIVGLNEMEHNGFSSSLIKGITASYKEIEK
jgi:pyrroline-5-carboxylate reductase